MANSTIAPHAPPLDLPAAKDAVWVAGTAVLAVIVLYFFGLDQGATSMFGSNEHLYEFLYDGRHLLGFPCH
ncbi:CbtB domain-containing protein [Mycobacterium sp. NPDC050041]|uniref:CbtB domain-containing protein n=1 Tax=Mycobacterium sp. NPDC050041 TaxID=3364293 RepID=UPI003C2EC355